MDISGQEWTGVDREEGGHAREKKEGRTDEDGARQEGAREVSEN